MGKWENGKIEEKSSMKSKKGGDDIYFSWVMRRICNVPQKQR